MMRKKFWCFRHRRKLPTPFFKDRYGISYRVSQLNSSFVNCPRLLLIDKILFYYEKFQESKTACHTAQRGALLQTQRKTAYHDTYSAKRGITIHTAQNGVLLYTQRKAGYYDTYSAKRRVTVHTAQSGVLRYIQHKTACYCTHSAKRGITVRTVQTRIVRSAVHKANPARIGK